MASSNVSVQQLKLALDKVLKPIESLSIKRERLTEFKLIAIGGFGSVFTAQLRENPRSPNFEIVAVKELKPAGDDEERIKLSTSFARELRVWSRVDHPNILPLVGFFMDAAAAVALFVTPFESHGNLRKYLKRETPGQIKRLDLAIDTSNGLLYLHTHEPPICHGDIKSLNVLVTAEGRAKLCDFGLAKVVEEHPSGLTTTNFDEAATARYMSLELFCIPGARRTLMSDVWAWGGVSLELFTGQFPYGECNNMQVYAQLLRGALPAALDSLRVSDRVRDLLSRCWEKDPDRRIKIGGCYDILVEEKRSLVELEQSKVSIIPQAYSPTLLKDRELATALDKLEPYRLARQMIIVSDRNGNMRRGKLRRSFRWAAGGASVAVTVFQAYGEQDDWAGQLLLCTQKMNILRSLDHPNILPFLGFDVHQEYGQLLWVSPWMDNGNLEDYIRQTKPGKPERIKLVSMLSAVEKEFIGPPSSQCVDVAHGLSYMHTLEPPFTHGSVKARNVLVNAAGQAILFNSQVTKVPEYEDPSAPLFKGIPRWHSPELFKSFQESLQADMWAWAAF